MSLVCLANCMFVSTLCTMFCFCWQINDDDDHADCRLMWFFVSLNIKKQAHLRLPLNVLKLEVFQLQGALPPPPPRPGLLSFVCCSINMVSLCYDIVYHFWHLCSRVAVSIRSGKLSFHDWKSRGILLQKTCRNPDSAFCPSGVGKWVLASRLQLRQGASLHSPLSGVSYIR